MKVPAQFAAQMPIAAATPAHERVFETHALMYHDIVDGDPAQNGFAGAGPACYKLSTAQFRAHLDAIGDALGR
jgi:hypothetical protein